MDYWEKINTDLSGQNGFIYIMFLNRNVPGEQVIDDLKKTTILAKPEDQVYSATKFLEKNNYIRQVRKEGRRKIRTANLEPLIETFEQFGYLYNGKILKIIGKTLNNFPSFAEIIFQLRRFNIKRKEWSILFDLVFYRYLHEIVTAASGDILGKKMLKSENNIFIGLSKGLINHYKFSAPRRRKPIKGEKNILNKLVSLETKIVNSFTVQEKKALSIYNIDMYSEALKSCGSSLKDITGCKKWIEGL